MMRPLIRPAALADSLDDPGCVLIDARAGKDAAGRFEERHLVGAQRADLETDLSGDTSSPARGGRHPLPGLPEFAVTLCRLGIRPASRVVVYDEGSGALAAARLWWMLRAVGHDNVSVLDGGLSNPGLPTESGPVSRPRRHALPYPVPDDWTLPTADIARVAALAPEERLLDVRSRARHLGEVEPIDPVAGHIPGARSAPLTAHLEGTRFLGHAALRAHFDDLLGDTPSERIIVSCGSGVTACHTLLAMAEAGHPGAALYVGSFSEWCRSGRPVERA
ncbi:MAG: sulfurtransferase [Sandaracinaceae bacterium]